jgi:putative ATPase
MRPRKLDEFVGQQHFIGEGKLLRRMLLADRVTSALFYGPPGTGKTTLATLIAAATKSHFEQVNAASVGVKEIREILTAARQRLETAGQRTILFVDELHRFNRAQQDVLLGDVENGVVILIGATTPLISRSQIFQFEPLRHEDVLALMRRAIADPERGFGRFAVTLTDDAAAHLAETCDGDARRTLTAIEIAVLSQLDRSRKPEAPIVIDRDVAAESIQRKAIQYDSTGDEHYDAISAMIKSMRGSDPDAAVYWLARMLEAGEDPLYVARRLVRFASEDIGNADPQALSVAVAAKEAVHFIGMPEGNTALAQAAIYLATAPKSNAVYTAYSRAADDARNGTTEPVPLHLRNAPTKLMRELEYGRGYRYAHDEAEGIASMECLPPGLADRRYYVPSDRGFEREITKRLAEWSGARRPRDDEPKKG